MADLDLVYSKSDAGSTGCNDGAKSSTGKTIVAPATGKVSSVWRPDTKTGSICFNYDSGGSMMFSHLQGYPSAGARVAVGAKLGTVAGPATGNNVPRNANVAHLHLTAFAGKDCQGGKVPFSTASNMRVSCSKDLTDDRQTNQWFKEAVWACPTGELGGLNMQGACDRQYPGQGRTAKVTAANDANSWRCVAKSGDKKSIDVTRECRYQFATTAFAKAKDSRNPYTWVCMR